MKNGMLLGAPFYLSLVFIAVEIVAYPHVMTVWSDVFSTCLLAGSFWMLCLHFFGLRIFVPHGRQVSLYLAFVGYHIVAGLFLLPSPSDYLFDTRLALQKYVTYLVFLLIMVLVDI